MKTIYNMNKDFDSKDEFYFSWYLDELIDAGYVLDYNLHPKEFILTDKQVVRVEKQLKTKTKIIEKTFLQPHVYTPDYLITWSNNAKGLLFSKSVIKGALPFCSSGYNFTYIEIKPTFSRYNMQRVFSLNQKFTFYKYGIYVQLVKPFKLFSDTFTPERFLTTDKSGKMRKINWEVRNLEEYVKGIT